MLKDEEAVKSLHFDVDQETDISKGVFVKRKAKNIEGTESKSFRFNFSDLANHSSSDALNAVTSQLKSVELS